MLKIKSLFILFIILFSCNFLMAKNSSLINIDLLDNVYRVIKKNFVGEINREKLFEESLKNVKELLKENKMNADFKEIKVTDDENNDIKNFLKEIDEISSTCSTDKLHKEDIIRAALDGLLKGLEDPYTIYMDPEEYREFSSSLEMESYSGVGIFIELDKKRNNRLTIIEPVEDSPAFNAGIQAGDVIIKINGKSTEGITMEESTKQIRGLKGSTVILTVERNEKEVIDYPIVRDVINSKNITYKMYNETIGYIRVRTFSYAIANELEGTMKELISQGAKSYIIDLRNNGGGYIESAVDISSKFLPGGNLIVTVNGNSPRKYKSRGTTHSDLPVVILINEFSASASEITAGAIQDNKRGPLIGTKSFGKGSVQTIYPIGLSGVLKITTAHYFTPSGRNIDKEGLTPDIEVNMEAYTLGKEKKDLQLQKAIDYLTGNK
jgi:carboxyl-terminal processing protease